MERSFRELRAWRVGMELAVLAFDVAAELPAEEAGDPLRLAALEVPQRLAAGAMDGRPRQWLRSLVMAGESLGGLEVEVGASLELRQISRDHGRRLQGLIGEMRAELAALRDAAEAELQAAMAAEREKSVQVAA